MPAKKPAKPTRLQVKADKKDKVLTGPKGSKPQSTTTNRVRTQGGTTMSKPKPAPSAGRRINPKAAKPKPAPKPAAKPATPSGGGRNLLGVLAISLLLSQKLIVKRLQSLHLELAVLL
jgi:hypothetical protein